MNDELKLASDCLQSYAGTAAGGGMASSISSGAGAALFLLHSSQSIMAFQVSQ